MAVKKKTKKKPSVKFTIYDLWHKIDYEGGFYEAFFSYGLDLEDYAVPEPLRTKLEKLVEKLRPLYEDVEMILEELEDAATADGDGEDG